MAYRFIRAAAIFVIVLGASRPPIASAQSKGVTFARQQDRVDIALNGKPVTSFHYEAKWDKPFLYPLRTLSGTILSRGYPVEPRAGEQQDHEWHRGIFYGHGDINGEDFWREKPDRTTSRLLLDGAPKTQRNSLAVRLAMMTPKGKRLGTIGERYTFRADGANLVIDSVISVAADQGEALKFGDTDDGGFAVRLSDDFRQDRGAELLNSDGLTGTEKIWGKPARWVKYSAKINGTMAGVAILDHPTNLRAPTAWHARGYSLNSANPFALGSFAKNKKSVDGSWTLEAGKTLTLRYQVIIHEGDLTPADVERYYAVFVKEPR